MQQVDDVLKSGVFLKSFLKNSCFRGRRSGLPQRGSPNYFGPLQLWSKPQPGGAVAIFVQSTTCTWGNEGQGGAIAAVQLSELPRLALGTTKAKSERHLGAARPFRCGECGGHGPD